MVANKYNFPRYCRRKYGIKPKAIQQTPLYLIPSSLPLTAKDEKRFGAILIDQGWLVNPVDGDVKSHLDQVFNPKPHPGRVGRPPSGRCPTTEPAVRTFIRRHKLTLLRTFHTATSPRAFGLETELISDYWAVLSVTGPYDSYDYSDVPHRIENDGTLTLIVKSHKVVTNRRIRFSNEYGRYKQALLHAWSGKNPDVIRETLSEVCTWLERPLPDIPDPVSWLEQRILNDDLLDTL